MKVFVRLFYTKYFHRHVKNYTSYIRRKRMELKRSGRVRNQQPIISFFFDFLNQKEIVW